jgi:hypothetical protein
MLGFDDIYIGEFLTHLEGLMMTAALLFTGEDGGDQDAGEDQRADLFEASGSGGVVLDMLNHHIRRQNPVEQPPCGQ